MRTFVIAISAVLSFLPVHARAYDKEMHQILGMRGALGSTGLERALREDLGFLSTTELTLRDGDRSLTVREWVGQGARAEDDPSRRSLRHFHNPLLPWSIAGFSFGPVSGMSSVLWGQNPNQDPGGTLGGSWHWAAARSAYLDAVSASTRSERDARLARAFRTLGHATHLIQDASVPAHVRNDPHLSFELGIGRIPINPDPYEDTIQDIRRTRVDRFEELLGTFRGRPVTDLFRPTDDVRAPVPVAGLIDTQLLRTTGIARGVLDPLDVGIAEFTNPNYLSGDTLFKNFAQPAQPAKATGSSSHKLSDARRVDLARRFVDDLHELLALRGHEVSAIENDGFDIEGTRVAFVESYRGGIEAPAVVLALDVRGDVPEGIAVLDLLGRRVHGSGGVVLDSVREFCRKRGIKLDPGPWSYPGGLV